jgi:CubicO group peptidase (beta-lactamase class C family)
MDTVRRVQLPGIAILLIACVIAKHGIAAAQKASEASLRERLEQTASSYTADNTFMGFVLVARGKEILRNKGYGKANLEQNIPNDPDTKFQIGSLTKQFTAALVLLLQQDAKLRIEDPVRKYLPDAPKSWDKITLTELLRHNSGIPEIQSDPRFRSSYFCATASCSVSYLLFCTDSRTLLVVLFAHSRISNQ